MQKYVTLGMEKFHFMSTLSVHILLGLFISLFVSKQHHPHQLKRFCYICEDIFRQTGELVCTGTYLGGFLRSGSESHSSVQILYCVGVKISQNNGLYSVHLLSNELNAEIFILCLILRNHLYPHLKATVNPVLSCVFTLLLSQHNHLRL